MKGNTRQGLKCKLCRMNVHAECQDKVVKCQPKAKFSRMKSGSEMGDDESKISFYVTEYLCYMTCSAQIWHWIFISVLGLSPRGSVGPDQKRQNFVNSKPPSAESQQLLTPPNELNSGEASPIRRKMGGSYSRYTGVAPLQRGLTIEGDLVDTSGRKINTSVTGNGSNGSNRNGGMTL